MIKREEADHMTTTKHPAKIRTENKRRVVAAALAILAIAFACAAVKAQQSALTSHAANRARLRIHDVVRARRCIRRQK